MFYWLVISIFYFLFLSLFFACVDWALTHTVHALGWKETQSHVLLTSDNELRALYRIQALEIYTTRSNDITAWQMASSKATHDHRQFNTKVYLSPPPSPPPSQHNWLPMWIENRLNSKSYRRQMLESEWERERERANDWLCRNATAK